MSKYNSLPLFLSFLIAAFTLLALGTWQLNKDYLVKKNKILYDFNQKSEPVKKLNFDLHIDNLTKVKVIGVPLKDKTVFLEPRTFKGVVGFHEITAYKVDSHFILVNKGFTKSKEDLLPFSSEKTEITGIIIKVPKPKFFELKNDLIQNIGIV